jgi:hypothetical protein
MAGEIPPLNITVNLETSGVQTGVNQATASIKNISAAAEGASGKFTGLKTVMLGTFASSAIQKGLSDFEGFLKESVKAAEEAQVTVAALGTAMNNAKVNTDANREAIMKSTEAMGNLGFKANDTRAAFTKMITATGSVTESQRLMGVAADYARLKHEDLATAAATLTRGTTGAMRAFREFGITLDTHIPKNEAIAKAFDQLNGKIGGQAAAYAQTYAGKMQVIGVQTEDLKEKIGNLLLPILTKLESWFIGAMKWLSEHKAAMEAIAFVVGTVLTAVVVNLTKQLYAQAAAWLAANAEIVLVIAAVALVAAGFLYLWNHFEVVRKGIVGGLQLIVHGVAFVIRALGEWAKFLENTVLLQVKLLLEALSHLPKVGKYAKEALDLFKAVPEDLGKAADSVDHFADKMENLSNKKIDIKFPNIKDALATAGGQSSGDSVDITGLVPGGNIDKGAAKAAAAAKKQADALAKAQTEMTKLQTDYQTVLQDRQDKMDAALATKQDADAKAYDAYYSKIADLQSKHDDAMQAAQDNFDTATANAHQAYTDKMTQIDADFQQKQDDLLAAHNDKIASLQQAAADKAVQLQQAAADKQQAIVQQSIDLLTSSWESATKIDVGKLFTSSGSTAEGLKSSLQEQLDAVLKLQKDAGQLAAAGYTQTFIQEVLAQGPQVGDQMAQSVLNATPETAAQIKSLYGQIQNVSQNGLDSLATQMNSGAQLATQKLMDQYAQVGVTLQQQMTDNAKTLQDSIAKENDTYAKALDAATDAHTKAAAAAQDTLDKALAKAQDNLTKAQDAANKALADGTAAAQATLTSALTSAQDAYDKSIKAISDSTDKQLTALMAKIDATAAKIQSLGGTVSGIGADFASNGSAALAQGNATASAADIAAMNAYALAHGLPLIGATGTSSAADLAYAGSLNSGTYTDQSGTSTSYNAAMAAAMKPVYVNVTNNVTGSPDPQATAASIVSATKFGMASL